MGPPAKREASSSAHVSVLLGPTIAAIEPRSGGRYLDATLGGGGHTRALLEASASDGRVLALDRDPQAVERASVDLANFGDRLTLDCANFRELSGRARDHGFDRFEGMVFDLGFSSDQLDDPERGLSFQTAGPLDMRLGPDAAESASDLVNRMEADDLADIIYRFGEERASRRIARAIVANRPIHTTTKLAEVVTRAMGGRSRGRQRDKIHPATRTFQALRIAVNDELAALDEAIEQAIDLLAPDGRLAFISFHSLEDRIVKHAFRTASRDCICPPELPECRCSHEATLRVITRKPVRPDEEEVARNPRARSARLRIAQRIP